MNRAHDLSWAALLERMAAGDPDACVALYDRSATVVFSLLIHIVGDRAAAEEVLRELYVDLMVRARRGEHRGSEAMVWVLSIARAAALGRMRTNPNAAMATSQPVDGTCGTHPLLAQLNDEQRTIVQMIYFGGLTAREAALRLGQPVQFVMSQLHSALSSLRTAGTSTALSQPAADPSRFPSRSTRSARYRVAPPRGSSPSPAW